MAVSQPAVRVECSPMRAFEVHLNGDPLSVAGIEADGVLSAIVSWVAGKNRSDCFLTVGGLISETGEHVNWIQHQPLKVGDKIELTISDTNKVIEPTRKNPEDQARSLEARKNHVRKLVQDLGWRIQESP